MVSPDGYLTIRPRLYESDLGGVRVPLAGVLSPVGAEERRAIVEGIDAGRRELTLVGESPGRLPYDQLVLCAGSRLLVPGPPGAVLSADDYEQSLALHEAVRALAEEPNREPSVVVVGGGFTGLELAAELSDMLADVGARTRGDSRGRRVHLVEQASAIAPEFGPRARDEILTALAQLGVESHPGVRVTDVDAGSVSLGNGRRIDCQLVVWAAGPRASALNDQLGVELDAYGRVPVDVHMATSEEGIWAAGDAARAIAVGDEPALMSCQHAMPQGRQAGENAVLAALELPLREYHQPLYVTCLDLGSAGAILTRGFDRDDVMATGVEAKRVKRFINRSVIYPPTNETELLALGATRPPGPLGARLQTFGLRRGLLRRAAIHRAPDRAARQAEVPVP